MHILFKGHMLLITFWIPVSRETLTYFMLKIIGSEEEEEEEQ